MTRLYTALHVLEGPGVNTPVLQLDHWASRLYSFTSKSVRYYNLPCKVKCTSTNIHNLSIFELSVPPSISIPPSIPQGYLRLYSDFPIPSFRNTAGFWPVPRTAVLGMGGTTVSVPHVYSRYSSILSAYGMALADVVHEAQRHCGLPFTEGEQGGQICHLLRAGLPACSREQPQNSNAFSQEIASVFRFQ